MTTAKKTNRSPQHERELSEKELNAIMRSMGDAVRAQTAQQKERLAAEIEKEIKAMRTAFANHVKNNFKA
jgi:hypothetical protein